MLFWPSRKNKVSQGHAPALSSFTWLSGKPFARSVYMDTQLEVNAGQDHTQNQVLSPLPYCGIVCLIYK